MLYIHTTEKGTKMDACEGSWRIACEVGGQKGQSTLLWANKLQKQDHSSFVYLQEAHSQTHKHKIKERDAKNAYTKHAIFYSCTIKHNQLHTNTKLHIE